MYLGTAVNLSLLNLKDDYQRMTIEMMEKHLVPIFGGLVEHKNDDTSVVEHFLCGHVHDRLSQPDETETAVINAE